MNADANNIEYSRAQLEEARRRLDSVHDRVKETKQKGILGAIDHRSDEIVVGEEMESIPEKHREHVVLGRREEEVKNIDGHTQNIVIDCQMCIELSVKSMFKAVGQDFDFSHGIGFSSHNTKSFNSEIPAEFPRNDDIIRAIFLTQLWEKFYEIAKYGAPELNVGPSLVFDIKDGERAINDASFCVELAEDFVDYVEESEQD